MTLENACRAWARALDENCVCLYCSCNTTFIIKFLWPKLGLLNMTLSNPSLLHHSPTPQTFPTKIFGPLSVVTAEFNLTHIFTHRFHNCRIQLLNNWVRGQSHLKLFCKTMGLKVCICHPPVPTTPLSGGKVEGMKRDEGIELTMEGRPWHVQTWMSSSWGRTDRQTLGHFSILSRKITRWKCQTIKRVTCIWDWSITWTSRETLKKRFLVNLAWNLAVMGRASHDLVSKL